MKGFSFEDVADAGLRDSLEERARAVLRLDPENLVARVHAAVGERGRGVANSFLWLIETAPNVTLGLHWMSVWTGAEHYRVREAWEAALILRGRSREVLLHAAIFESPVDATRSVMLARDAYPESSVDPLDHAAFAAHCEWVAGLHPGSSVELLASAFSASVRALCCGGGAAPSGVVWETRQRAAKVGRGGSRRLAHAASLLTAGWMTPGTADALCRAVGLALAGDEDGSARELAIAKLRAGDQAFELDDPREASPP